MLACCSGRTAPSPTQQRRTHNRRHEDHHLESSLAFHVASAPLVPIAKLLMPIDFLPHAVSTSRMASHAKWVARRVASRLATHWRRTWRDNSSAQRHSDQVMDSKGCAARALGRRWSDLHPVWRRYGVLGLTLPGRQPASRGHHRQLSGHHPFFGARKSAGHASCH